MAAQEDTPPGTPVELGRVTFTAGEIVRFARLYDPQPFHVDAAAAARSPFGGLIASGWHTVVTWMGLFVRAHGPLHPAPPDGAQMRPEVIAPVGVGFGITDLEWREPVRPGDQLIFSAVVDSTRPSASRPGWAIYRRHAFAHRPDGTCVMRFSLTHLAPVAAGLRPAAAAPDGHGAAARRPDVP